MSKVKYKFAIMLNGLYMYPWQKLVYDQILQDSLAEPFLVILKKEKENSIKPNGLVKKLLAPNLLFEQFKKRKLNTSTYLPIPLGPIEGNEAIEKMVVEPTLVGKKGESFSPEIIDQIKSKELDFIIRFGFGILKGDILTTAKWGIWSFHHGDEQSFRGGPPGFWEIFKGQNKQGVILQVLTEKLDAGKIILKRQYSVISHSYAENVAKLMFQSADMPAQAVRMIAGSNLRIQDLTEIKTTAPIYRYPTNFQFIRFQCKILINRIRFKWIKLFKQENWLLAYRKKNSENYHYIAANGDGEYYADPFLFNNNGKTSIVAEHYSYKSKKGSIVLIEPGMNQVKTLIEKETHLSYPFIFEEDGNTYMLPEEGNTGSLNLYKWNKDLKEFEFVQSILNLPAIDASLLKHEGLYYLFTGLKDQLPNEKLFIYYATDLGGPYLPHASNPVKVSPEGARMAGGFIIKNGEVIRPSQYSVKYYGEKIIFQKILQLSPTLFHEEFYDELKPHKNAPFKCGLHTYHSKNDMEIIDLKTMRSGYTAFKAQL